MPQHHFPRVRESELTLATPLLPPVLVAVIVALVPFSATVYVAAESAITDGAVIAATSPDDNA